MQSKIEKLFSSTAGLLTFAILSGGGYFAMILRIIKNFSRGNSGFIGYMFAPAIVCIAAIYIVKTVKSNIENEQMHKNIVLFWFHILVIAMGIIFALDMIV